MGSDGGYILYKITDKVISVVKSWFFREYMRGYDYENDQHTWYDYTEIDGSFKEITYKGTFTEFFKHETGLDGMKRENISLEDIIMLTNSCYMRIVYILDNKLFRISYGDNIPEEFDCLESYLAHIKPVLRDETWT